MRRVLIIVLLGMSVLATVPSLTQARSVQGGSLASRPAVAATPGPMHGMGGDPWHGFTKTGDAVRSVLLRLGPVCGHPTTGTGYALFTPGVAGSMHGPHMILQVSLKGSRGSARWGLETNMRQGSIIRDDSSVGMLVVNRQGNGNLVERTMPMIHPGTYTVQLLIHDQSCGSGNQHPVAYKTAPARIEFKGAMSM